MLGGIDDLDGAGANVAKGAGPLQEGEIVVVCGGRRPAASRGSC